ncbi:MAG: hypothetical protein K6G48_01420 [Acholeplasmatales bacterium]|nr:hypothetical protein [Acholeplasmatales bacterium]
MEKLREIKNGELYYNGFSLKKLAEEYGTPLKITFLDVISEHINSLKRSFNNAISSIGYKGKFIYLNANKANYGKEEIETAFLAGDGLETSSYYDLLLTQKMFEKNPDHRSKLIVSNGLKLKDYCDEIVNAYNKGLDIIDIIDDLNEYEYLKSKNLPIKVGFRVHLSSLYEAEVPDDRFGLLKDEIDYILNDIKNTKLILTTIHYHQRGFDYVEDKFKENLLKAFNFYLYAKSICDSVDSFDIGGGMPLPISEDFDYDSFALSTLSYLKELCIKNNVSMPNIIGENGKFSQKDSTVNIYKVVGVKNTGEYPWHIVNGSLLIALPEMYALGEPIMVTPISNLDKPIKPVRLAGITCDCDDVFFDREKGYFELPDAETNYIGCIGTGSYQNSMNGKGGVHHCLLPEEKDVIIYTKDGKLESKVRHELQSIEDIYNIINFK